MRCGRQIPDFWKKKKLSQPNRQTRNTGIRWKMYLNSRQITLTRRPRQMRKVTLKFRYSLERFYHRESICCRWWERASRSEYISQQIPAESQVWTFCWGEVLPKRLPGLCLQDTHTVFFFFFWKQRRLSWQQIFPCGPRPTHNPPTLSDKNPLLNKRVAMARVCMCIWTVLACCLLHECPWPAAGALPLFNVTVWSLCQVHDDNYRTLIAAKNATH